MITKKIKKVFFETNTKASNIVNFSKAYDKEND